METLSMRDANATARDVDNTFGPQADPRFDFTLKFEHAILTTLPASLLLFVGPLYLFRFLRSPVYFKRGLLLWAKLAVATILLAVEIANTVITSRHGSSLRNATSIAAAALSCASMLSVMAVLYAEHFRSFRSSSFISILLSITMLFNAARARSYMTRDDLGVFGALQIAIAILKLTLVLLEELPKRSLLRSRYTQLSMGPENSSGFWNRSLFLWINETLLIGFKDVLSAEGLPDIGKEFSTEALAAEFQTRWETVNKSSRYCLLVTSLRSLGWSLVTIVVPRLFFMGFTFVQPFLLHAVVRAVGQQGLSKDAVGGLIGATALVYFGLAVTRAYYTHAVYRCVTMNRGMLVSAIFQHTLQLDLATAKKSAAVTLMSTDVDNIASGFTTIHDLWAQFIEFGIGVYLLARYVGAAAFLVVVPAVLSTVSSHLLAKKNGPARKAWNGAVQTRVSATTQVLGQIKGIKMTGLAPSVMEYLQTLRVTEVNRSKDLRKIIVYMHALAQFFNTNTPILVIAGGLFWTNRSRGLDAADTFATISLTRLVSGPMSKLLVGFPQATSLLACFSRIQTFLLLQQQTGKRGHGLGQQKDSASRARQSHDSEHPQRAIELQNIGTALSRGSNASQPIFTLTNVSVAPTIDAPQVLRGLDLQIMSSQLMAVVGPVGSGKTTLLRALLGEAQLTGTIRGLDQKSTAYCDQVSWLRNISIRDNIVGPAEFDNAWYNTVVKCCLLDEDFRDMPHGDQTTAGSGGANLSGGQKQRVALARAVYSRRSVLIIDDVLSALDRNTSSAVMDRLLGPHGLLRTLGTTVIMATHSPDHVALADVVLVLDGKGNVEVQFNTSDAARKSTLIEEFRKTNVIDAEEQQQGNVPAQKPAASQEVVKGANETNDKKKKLERQRGDLGLYKFYIVSSGLWRYIAFILMAAINMLWSQMPSIFLRIWLEKAPDDKTYFVGYVALGVTCCFSSAVMLAFYMLKVAPSSATKLHWTFLETVMRATLGFLSSTDSGSLLNRFSQDMSLINQALPLVILNFAIVFFDNLVSLGIVASGASYAAIVIPFLITAVYFIQYFYLRTSRQMRHLDLEAKSPLYTQFSETAAGVQHIRAFSWQSNVLSQSFELVDLSQKPYYYMFCIQRWLTLVLELSVMVIAIVLVTLALKLPHTSSASAIGLAMLNVVSFGTGMAEVIATWTRLETSLGAIARLRTFLEETPTEKDQDGNPDPPENWPQHGRIEFQDVIAKYNPEDERQVLNDVSVTIEPGQKVGVVGRTGSGKSSLILTLLNLLDQSGSVIIDGLSTRDVTRQRLRSRITVIAQDPVELPGSVRHNLTPFYVNSDSSGSSAIDDAVVEETLLRIGLWEHVSASGGLEADFAVLGLSQGQRQLFCLARAVLHHKLMGSRIVLVDEATSNVDVDTDRRMQEVMADEFADCTVVTVAHRLETIRDVDVVLEMSGGSLALRREVF